MSPEVAVSVSDFVLAAFSGLLAWRVLACRTDMQRTRRWFAVVLWAISAGALLGGISHGFIPEDGSRLGALLWRATLISIGPAAVGLWMLGSILLFRPAGVERSRTLALLGLAIYVGVVLFEFHEFVIAMLIYVPGTLLLLVGFAVHLRTRDSFAGDGFLGMVLTLVAGGLQYLRVGVHPVYFNHNALYHLLQGIALFFLYRAGRKWLEPGASKLRTLKTAPIVARIG